MTASWMDSLSTMNADAIRPLFPASAVADADKARQLSTDRRHIRRTDKAVMLDARRLANAIEHLGRLPDPGESFHLVTEKKYSMMHVIPAVLHYADPATIRYLAVVTLSFSQPNMLDLLAMLDSGQIEKVDFLYSCYFKSNEKENCQRLTEELTSRGQRVFAGLIHAKILLIETTAGRTYSVESSANLRSCSSIEQITMTHDRSLFDFHQQWLNEVMEGPSK
ncbi:MAG: hypothetical protein WCJ35_12785 [Planctomycetota bacterium]